MAQFVSSFITGFSSVVEQNLPKLLPTVKIIKVLDGLIFYSYNGDSRDIERVVYFNNTFFVMASLEGKNLNFQSLFQSVLSKKTYFLINKGSCRVRFNKENQFEKVDKNLSSKAESFILKNSKLKIDRVSPDTEIWFSIRSEGFGFAGQLISKREFTEKNLYKGELRPEFAYLMGAFARIEPSFTVAEPFCGYGAVPVQIIKKFRCAKLYASDIDDEKISVLKEKKQFKDNPVLDLRQCDAFELKHIADKSVDIVITDPPWGFFEDVGDISVFYEKMLKSFDRILKSEGKIILLSARKEELEAVIEKTADLKFCIEEKLNTLVNGKKASLYRICRKQ